MTKYLGGSRPLMAVALALVGTAAPAVAQDSNADARIRRLEAEVRNLKQQAGVAGTVAPQTSPTSASAAPGVPASTPVADLLARMESIESQLARLTAQNEESGNKLRLLEERVAASEAAAKAAAPVMAASTDTTASPALVGPPADPAPTASSSNLSAMAAPTPKPPTPRPAAAPAPAPKPAVAAPAKPAATAPSARRLAAVRAIAKPATGDAMEDEYTYGFRLWEAKFYPETRQQLQLFIDKYPRSSRVSYARNLIGRSLLEEGQPYEAARWFLQNYSANDKGDRAPDSLLYLAEAMRQHKDNGKACQALTEFGSVYPREAAGRLKGQYDTLRGQLTCN